MKANRIILAVVSTLLLRCVLFLVEDMQLMVGLSGEERALTPWRRSLPKRLPWLYVNLLTAFAAAAVTVELQKRGNRRSKKEASQKS